MTSLRQRMIEDLKIRNRSPKTIDTYVRHVAQFARWVSALYQKEWVVYCEPPEGREPEQVLKYLARYTHRVAISNHRIASIDGEGHEGQVTFWYKDYARQSVWKTMTLAGVEFLRRFIEHVLPPGLVRIRSFGFMANRHRAEKLALVRHLLAIDQTAGDRPPPVEPTEDAGSRCPHCGQPALQLVSETGRPSMAFLVALTYCGQVVDST